MLGVKELNGGRGELGAACIVLPPITHTAADAALVLDMELADNTGAFWLELC